MIRTSSGPRGSKGWECFFKGETLTADAVLQPFWDIVFEVED